MRTVVDIHQPQCIWRTGGPLSVTHLLMPITLFAKVRIWNCPLTQIPAQHLASTRQTLILAMWRKMH